MKSIQGEYEDNRAIGVWTWWDEEGNVSRQENFDKLNREQDGSIGELTDPGSVKSNRQQDDDGGKESSIFDDSVKDDLQPAKASDDSDSEIPLLLDTEGLEEIDPLDVSGELPEAVFGDEQP
jgi:hypothetical protein